MKLTKQQKRKIAQKKAAKAKARQQHESNRDRSAHYSQPNFSPQDERIFPDGLSFPPNFFEDMQEQTGLTDDAINAFQKVMNPQKGETPTGDAKLLFDALGRNDVKTAEELIEKDPELVHAVDENQKTPLFHAACCTGATKLIQCLFDNGADGDVRDNENFSVLYDCMRGDFFDNFKLMLDYGVDPNSLSGLGNPIMQQCLMTQRFRYVELLLEYGADPEHPLPGQDISCRDLASQMGAPEELVRQMN